MVRESPTGGPDARLDDLLWLRAGRARRLTACCCGGGGEQSAPRRSWPSSGTIWGRLFLPQPVAQRLEATIAEATRLNVPLELGLEIADPALVDLPWELLRPPLGANLPLALHPRVDLYRLIALGRARSPALRVPRPLRILVAIGSPEAQNPRGELLDMEAELGRILDATERARQEGKAAVRILEIGARVKAISSAPRARARALSRALPLLPCPPGPAHPGGSRGRETRTRSRPSGCGGRPCRPSAACP